MMHAWVLTQLVDVASQCYDVGNFNTLMEIISGLSHSSVTRLKVSAGQTPLSCVRACVRASVATSPSAHKHLAAPCFDADRRRGRASATVTSVDSRNWSN
jgi:hypothetical protein